MKRSIKQQCKRIQERSESKLIALASTFEDIYSFLEKHGSPSDLMKQIPKIKKAASELSRAARSRELKPYGKEILDSVSEIEHYAKLYIKNKKWNFTDDENEEEEYESLLDFLFEQLTDVVSLIEDEINS